MAKKLIELKNICKAYDGEQILSNVNLYINDHEFITLLGPSGCGKTTTLRIIGGFETPDTGDVYFDGKSVKNVPPHQRPVNTVFQRYALFPHLNIFENIGMNLGVMPITGLPLPFVSKGGSAMITNFFAIGVLLSVSLRRKRGFFEDM